MNWEELNHSSLDDILAWAEPQPWCRAMAQCAQDAEWHSEGDVWTHTKMVFEQLSVLDEWSYLPANEQVIRKLAAKCEPPTWTEGHALIMSNGESQ